MTAKNFLVTQELIPVLRLLLRCHPLYPIRAIVVNIMVLNKLPQRPSAPAQPHLLTFWLMLQVRCHPSRTVDLLLIILTNKMARLSTLRLSALLQLLFIAQPTYTFSTIIMDQSNVTLLSQQSMISAQVVSHPMLLLLLIRANLHALLDSVPVVTTMVTTVHGAYKHTQLQGWLHLSSPPPQGCPRTDNCGQLSVAYLPRMTIHILAISI